MKYVVLVPDGAADYPLEQLGGKTPLQAADMPNIRKLAADSTVGLTRTIPEGLPAGSDVANLSILGYDPTLYYSGRGPLEAAYQGIELMPGDFVFRCNLVTIKDGKMADYSAGHIDTQEAAKLIKELDKRLGSEKVKFYSGVSYRHLVVFKDTQLSQIKAVAPHDVIGQPLGAIWPEGEGAEILIDLTKKSAEVLKNQPSANMIWLWGGGTKKELPSFYERYSLKGGVISAVDLVKGLAVSAGLRAPEIPTATGYYDTDYEAKAKEALSVLEKDDFVYVHVEAPDEAGHTGNISEKVKALENFDKRLAGLLLQNLDIKNTRILLLPDHATPIKLRTHTSDAVPFMLYPGESGARSFDEQAAAKAADGIIEGHRLMQMLVRRK